MYRVLARSIGNRFYYGWVAVAVTFLVLLTSTGIRATPSVLMVSWEHAFGWDRATISIALSVSLFLFGMMGPFAAAAMQTLGIRTTVLFGPHLADDRHHGQLVHDRGLADGGHLGPAGRRRHRQYGAGAERHRLHALVRQRRGLVLGVLTASVATGQLVFLPMFASVAAAHGWQSVIYILMFVPAAMIPLVYFLLPNRPSDVGLAPYGQTNMDAVSAPTGNPLVVAFTTLAAA